MNMFAKILIFRTFIFFLGLLFLLLDIESKQFDAINGAIYITLLGYWIIDVLSITNYHDYSLTYKAIKKK